MNKKQKNLVSIVLTLVMAFMPITTAINNNVNAATNETVNLALNATVTTSSNENDSLAGKYAVDGDSSTRWSSAFNDGEWIMVDLGSICTVGCVNIEWEDAYASTYTIMWSQDNVTWYTASTSTIHSSAKTTNMFYNRPVRYIKVVCDKRATVYGSSIYELEVMGLGNQTPTEVETTTEEVITPTTNLALGKYVLSSSNEDDSLLAANAVDGNTSTRWSSAWRDGEWIMIDLGKLYNVSYLTIDWEAAFASKYTVSWSQDNITWNDALTLSTSVASSQTHMMYNRPIRYIKITANTRGTSYGASIYEIGVFGFTYDPDYVYKK